MYDEVSAMRTACGQRAHLKTILAVGELGSYSNVYAASMTCMLAGADFIKTSTGKEVTVNATLPVSIVMCRAISDFHDAYGVKVRVYELSGGFLSEICFIYRRLYGFPFVYFFLILFYCFWN